MSYYASDPANADDLIERLTPFFDTARSIHWYALMDLAFDEGRQTWPLATTAVPLYASGRLAQLQSVSPVLFDIPVGQPDEAARLLRRLNAHAAGRPMLSFMASALSAHDLAGALQSVLEVATADGQTFLLRWADTRVLSVLPLALTATHWRQLCVPLSGWHAVDRHGALTALPAPAQTADLATPASPLQLDDLELAALLQAGEADALISALDEEFPDLMPKLHKAAMHTEAQHVCALADAQGIDGTPDRLSLVLVNRLAGGNLWRDARLVRWLGQRDWQKGRFAEALSEFVEILK